MKKLNILFILVVIIITILTYLIGKGVTITGKATEPLIEEEKEIKEFGVYAFTPSFRYKVDSNFFDDYHNYEIKANQTRDSMIICLEQGSYRNDDDNDLETCKNLNPNKEIIKDVEDLDGEFYIKFEIKDKATIRFALHLQDNIPPPDTENIRIVEEVKDEEKKVYLEWDKNKASDVVAYDIYYIQKDSPYLGLSDLTQLKLDFIGERVEITNLDYNNTDFFVIAKDEVGNYKFEII